MVAGARVHGTSPILPSDLCTVLCVSASRNLSRCVVTLETSGAGAEQRIDAAAEGIEVLFDELEETSRVFVSPRSPAFRQPQLGIDRQADETCRVELLCTPQLASSELQSLALRVAVLLSELPDVTPRDVRAVQRAASEADTDPGEPQVATREHVAKTRPEGLKKRPVRVVAAADEVTDPQSSPREEVPTRPQDVIAIRRR